MGRLDGKTALITGATSGMGHAAAILFAKEGAKVVCVGTDKARGDAVVKTIKDSGGEAIFVQADVSKASDAERMVKTAVDTYGRLDILYNNAGIWIWAPTHEMKEEDWDRQMAVNLKGVWLGCKYAIPQMIKQGEGAIVNTSSTYATIGAPENACYSAAKYGVIALTKEIAISYAPHKIRANALLPGDTLTPMIENWAEAMGDKKGMIDALVKAIPLGRMGTPEDMAKAALFLASDESAFITGTTLTVDGGFLATDSGLMPQPK